MRKERRGSVKATNTSGRKTQHLEELVKDKYEFFSSLFSSCQEIRDVEGDKDA